MQSIVFATHNNNKLAEVRAMLPKLHILGLNDIGCFEEIPENADTFHQNALAKVNYVVQKYGYHCFSDDSGLAIDFLNGKPGVFSARYAGEPSNSEKNIIKVLDDLKDVTHRSAHFITVIALHFKEKTHYFEGKVFGNIIHEKRGINGFGYDPIFVPQGYDKTFAEMTKEEKSKISHRGIAVAQLVEFLLKNT